MSVANRGRVFQTFVNRAKLADMASALWYFLPYLIPLTVLSGIEHGGLWTFQTPVWVFLIIPLLDELVGEKTRNPDESKAPSAISSLVYKAVVWGWAPVQWALLLRGIQSVTSADLTALEQVGVTVSVGLITGAIGITFAHELCHRPSRFERALAEILMASVSYTHFVIEHIHGHHRRVATPDDPATARLGESFYAFYPRTILGGLVSAWQLERNRLARRGRPVWHPTNRMLRFGLEQIVLYGTMGFFFGWKGILFWSVQAVIAFTMLEVINYLEHYGLIRKEIKPGVFETVKPWHSWNSSHFISNIYLINLARHSDHHYRAGRRYERLRHFEDAPQLPAGYAAMFLVALVPPFWFAVMDSRVERWRARYA